MGRVRTRSGRKVPVPASGVCDRGVYAREPCAAEADLGFRGDHSRTIRTSGDFQGRESAGKHNHHSLLRRKHDTAGFRYQRNR